MKTAFVDIWQGYFLAISNNDKHSMEGKEGLS
jgi:hypothetical protein